MADQTDRIHRMMEVFRVAVRLDPDDRDRYVVEVDEDDPELGASLRRLLTAERDVRTDGYLEPSGHHLGALLPSDGLDPDLGRLVGPYQLLNRLGSGGMGTVYRAVRRDDYEQIVAVKLVRPDLDGDEIVHRFLYERQTLAGLSHPNIARLLDGGTDDGRPYFVMELVDGQPIDEWCDHHQLSVRGRLELMLPVCDAVAHAHDLMVVHRDIKPANILVTQDGRPKLLDFGLARVLSPELGFARADETDRPLRHASLAYASPEQLLGDTVGKPVDVYALGGVVFRLLTGRKPFWLDGLGWDDAVRVVAYRPPPRPSQAVRRTEHVRVEGGPVHSLTPRLVASARATTPEQLHRALHGDLDTIMLTALQKEPRDRYPDARALQDDLRRFLDDRPIAVQPVSWPYVAGKFIQRHRVAVRWAAGLFAALLLALAATTWALWSTVRHRDAEVARQVAEQQRADLERRMVSKRLAGLVVLDLVDDPRLALRLAIEAVEAAPTPIAAFALRRSLLGTRRDVPPPPYTGVGGPYCFGPDGDRLVSASGREARLWEIGPNRLISAMRHDADVRTVALARDAVRVLTCADDGSLWLWRGDREERLWRVEPQSDPRSRVASFTPDGRWVVASNGGAAAVLETERGTTVTGSPRRPIAARRRAASPAGDREAAVADDGSIGLRVTGSDEVVATMDGHWTTVRWLAFDATGTRLVSCGEDGVARVWSADDGSVQLELRPDDGPLDWAAVSPTGQWILTAGRRPILHVWDAVTGALLREQEALGAAFTPDGGWLVIVEPDGDLSIVPWEMFAPTEHNLAVARERAGRPLGDDERAHYVQPITEDIRRELLRELSGK